jgi:peptidoglycan/LPS O-acetylase OafA/YrhL
MSNLRRDSFLSGTLKPPVLSAPASAHLDCIRSVAASAVMWGHLRAFFFVDFQELPHRTLFLKVLYFLTGFGHEAVMIFFVLSGFLISSSIVRNQASGKWSWGEYALSRSTRLYVVLIPGLLFGTLWDIWGKSLFASTGLYSLPLASFGGLIVQNELTVRNFFGNLFFLQTIVCHTYGSNGPLWSIANEFWYYVLFPMGLLACQKFIRKAFAAAVLLSVSALGITLILGPVKIVGFLIWMAGFVVVILWERWRLATSGSRAAYLFLSALIWMTCLSAARLERLSPLISDVAVGLAFSAFLFGVLQLDFRIRPAGLYLRSAHLFAGFSYSLYVLHFPLLLFLRAWIVPGQRWQPDGRHIFYGFGIGVAILTFAWLVARVTENKTADVRRSLRTLLHASN